MTGEIPEVQGERILAERLAGVRERIVEAARAAGRDPEDITLIAVTKFHPVDLIDRLWALGVRDFGENRHPEARDKSARVNLLGDGARLHFIGQLQRNKVRQVARYADVIQSIDRDEVVDALTGIERDRPLEVTVQVSLDGDPLRGGAVADDVERIAERILENGALTLRGVMGVAPLGVDPAAAFADLRAVSERVRRIDPDATWISGGMSHDFPSAISQGATHLRIGEAITGKRPVRP